MLGTSTTGVAPLPATLNEKVLQAVLLRLGGIPACLVILDIDGNFIYRAPSVNGFFNQFALPALSGQGSIREALQALAEQEQRSFIVNDPAGIVAGFSPLIEKRRTAGYIGFVCRGENFSADNEFFLNACQRMQADARWIWQQGQRLQSFDEAMMRQHLQSLELTVADQIALAGLHHELTAVSEQLSNSYEELSLIYHLSGGMRVNRGTFDFFRQACIDLQEVLGVRCMGVVLQPRRESPAESTAYGETVFSDTMLRELADKLIDQMRRDPRPIIINDLRKSDGYVQFSKLTSRMIAVPLQRQEQVLGCFFGIDKKSDFDSTDAKLLNSIGNESAVYLENAMLYDDVHGLMMGVLHGLTAAVDAKDAYTHGHSERVALLSRELAQHVGMTDQQVERIYIAGLLHDVGKIGISESVLRKSGRLTDEEFAEMKKHPEIGARILNDIKQLKDIIPGVLCHHERYDGKGYPNQLVGKHIPLMGRILCLADSFDAMTSSRTYRTAMTVEKAVQEIRRSRGTQFDPDLADRFLDIGTERLAEILYNHRKAAEQHPRG